MNKSVQIVVALLIALLVAGGVYFFTAEDNRTLNEHVGDAVGALDEGVDDAARELEDRTPAERLSDEVEDATDGDAE
jgi:hypothetical protein